MRFFAMKRLPDQTKTAIDWPDYWLLVLYSPQITTRPVMRWSNCDASA